MPFLIGYGLFLAGACTIAALANPITTSLTVSAGLFALCGVLATRRRRSAASVQGGEIE